MIWITKLIDSRIAAAAAATDTSRIAGNTNASTSAATVAAAAAAYGATSLIMTVLIMLMIVMIMMMRRLILILSGNDAAHILQIAATATRPIQLWANAQERGRAIDGIHNGLQQAAALKFMCRDFTKKCKTEID